VTVADDPERLAELLATGVERLRAGDGDGALAALSEAERLATEAGDAAGRAAALRHRSAVLRQRSEWEGALALAREAARVAREAGLTDALAEALNAEAVVHQSRGAFDEAAALLEAVVATTTDRRISAIALGNLGSIAAQRGDIALARRHFVESARRFDESGFAFGAAAVLNNFGRAALDLGNARVALPMLEDALGAARRAGDAELVAVVRRNLAEAHGAAGDLARGEAMARAALDAFTATHNLVRRAECLRVLAELAHARGDAAAAAARLAEAEEAARAAQARQEMQRLEDRRSGSWPRMGGRNSEER
jgi:tetratricopeptide (TPR) repeat protein